MKNITLALTCLALVGCASTTIYPAANNTFTSVTTSSEQSYAEKDALKRARAHCEKMGKQLQVLKHESKYQGMKKSDQAVLGAISTVLIGVNTAKRSDDYRVALKFRCK